MVSWTLMVNSQHKAQTPTEISPFSTSSLSAGTHNILVTATDSTGLTASTSLVLQINLDLFLLPHPYLPIRESLLEPLSPALPV